MNITLDDTSPQFRYYSKNNTWQINHAVDNKTPEYYDATFHGTYTDGDSMSLTFNGTAVYIYGAKRDNHGTYSASIDGGNEQLFLGYNAAGAFQQVLYSAAGLEADKSHTVTLTNLPSETKPPGNSTLQWWLDIDFAVITTNTTGQIYTTRIDNTSPLVQYGGRGWDTGPPLQPQDYYNTTAQITQVAGDSMSLSFNGTSVQLLGGLYKDHGNYTISLDGNQVGSSYSGHWFELATQVPLFTATELEDGPHHIIMTNIGGPNGNFIDFDYAIVNSTINPSQAINNGSSTGTNTTSGSADTTSPASAGGSSSNAGAIAGGVVGGVVGLALVGVLAWWLLFRRRKHERQAADDYREKPHSNGQEVQPFDHYDLGGSGSPTSHSQAMYSASSSGNMASSQSQYYASPTNPSYPASPSAREADQSGRPFLSTIPPPPPSNVTSYPLSHYAPSAIGSPPASSAHDNPFSGGTPPSAGSDHSAPYPQPHPTSFASQPTPSPHTPASPVPPLAAAIKSPGVALPFTARGPASHASSNSLSSGTGRMYVPGREMDLGPIPVHPEEEEDGAGVGHVATLPPDYRQATEPLPGQVPPRVD